MRSEPPVLPAFTRLPRHPLMLHPLPPLPVPATYHTSANTHMYNAQISGTRPLCHSFLARATTHQEEHASDTVLKTRRQTPTITKTPGKATTHRPTLKGMHLRSLPRLPPPTSWAQCTSSSHTTQLQLEQRYLNLWTSAHTTARWTQKEVENASTQSKHRNRPNGQTQMPAEHILGHREQDAEAAELHTCKTLQSGTFDS